MGSCSRPGRSSTAATRFSPRSPKAGWGRCIAPGGRCSATRSRSRSSSATGSGSRRRARTLHAREPCLGPAPPPNIVSILDFNIEPDGHPFLVMELLNGRSLKDELAAAGRMSIEDVRRIVPPLCTALQFAHGLGIVHRDLKPANIVAHEFTPGERVYKLVDFGLANIRETDPGRAADRAARVHRHDRVRLARAVVRGSRRRALGRLQPGRDGVRDADRAGAVSWRRSAHRAERPSQFARAAAVVAPSRPAGVARRDGLPRAGQESGRSLDRHRRVRARAVRRRRGAPDRRASRSRRPRRGCWRPTSSASGSAPGDWAAKCTAACTARWAIRWRFGCCGASGDRNWEGARARFLREAQALQVAHPSIIQVRDYGEEGDLVYLVTDYIEGPSLRELMQAARPAAVAAAPAPGRAAGRGRARAAPPQGPAVRREPGHHAHRDRRGRRAADDLERGGLAGVGSAGDAPGADAARRRRWPTSSCDTSRRSC